MMSSLSCFKGYDVRGKLGDELDEGIVYPRSAKINDRTDDYVSIEFAGWHLNLLSSNTEPLLRLSVETRGNPEAMSAYVHELAALTGAAQ